MFFVCWCFRFAHCIVRDYVFGVCRLLCFFAMLILLLVCCIDFCFAGAFVFAVLWCGVWCFHSAHCIVCDVFLWCVLVVVLFAVLLSVMFLLFAVLLCFFVYLLWCVLVVVLFAVPRCGGKKDRITLGCNKPLILFILNVPERGERRVKGEWNRPFLRKNLSPAIVSQIFSAT